MSEKKQPPVGASLGNMDGFKEEAEDGVIPKDVIAGMIKSFGQLALMQKIRFDCLKKVGFTDEQALDLCWRPVTGD